jgi:hypothetical protein
MSKDYIEGIVVFYMGDELVKMSESAAKYHAEKSEGFRKLAKEFEKLKGGETRDLSPEALVYNMKSGSSHRGDPVQSANDDAATHERKKRLHTALAAHYDKNSRYGLTINDLSLYGLYGS